jgi:hypothetical protein
MVADTIPPIALCQDVTVYLDAGGIVNVFPGDLIVISDDNCGIVDSTINGQPSIQLLCSNLGINPAAVRVEDAAGNAYSCFSVVTVVDTVPPNLVCIDVTVTLDEFGVASVDSNFADGGSSDACGIDSISLSQTDFTCDDYPNLDSLIMTVVDIHGNADTCHVNLLMLGTDVDNDGYIAECEDCNDMDSLINPGADEICGDLIDNNCDTLIDDFNGFGYCCATGTNPNFFIQSVRLAFPQANTVRNVISGPDMFGYGNYVLPKGNIQANNVPFIYFNIKPGLNRLTYFRIWVDWNQNGTFDPWEVMAQRRTNNTWNGQFSVPAAYRNTPAEYYIRISASGRGYIDDPCSVDAARAEFEDYIICIANGCPPPQPPPLQQPVVETEDPEFSILNSPFSIAMRPNPFSDVLRIEIGLQEDGDIHMKLIDQAGREVIDAIHPGVSGFNQFDLNTESLATGLYYLHVETASGVVIKKVVKTNTTLRP